MPGRVNATAYLFPGQGSQAVGMGWDLVEQFASAKEVFREADDVLGFPLSRLCFEGPESDLRRTLNTQPAVFVASWACLRAAIEAGVLDEQCRPIFVAGHSLGEYTAVVAAGSLSFADALKLVHERARLMEDAGQRQPGTMAAVIGMERQALEEVCAEAGVEVANRNAPDQTAISGDVKGIERAMEMAKARGARRVLPLPVGGAFHSRLMAPASEGMLKALGGVIFRDPVTPVVANTSAAPLTSGEEVRAELARQLCATVRWQDSVEFMGAQGVTDFVEIGPGKVLSGLVKRITPEAQTRNLNDCASLQV